MEQLFSSKDVCRILKISQSTLSRRVAAGEFPPPRKLYPHGENRWTGGAIEKVIANMPVADAYRNSGYYERDTQVA